MTTATGIIVIATEFLFANSDITSQISGLEPNESKAMLTVLCEHIANPRIFAAFPARLRSGTTAAPGITP
jgi:alpha-ketoglutarate-dependent taurine dioxygenase